MNNPTYKEYQKARGVVMAWEFECARVKNKRKQWRRLSVEERLWEARENLAVYHSNIKNGPKATAYAQQYHINFSRRAIEELLLERYKKYRHGDIKDWRTANWCDEKPRTIGNLISKR